MVLCEFEFIYLCLYLVHTHQIERWLSWPRSLWFTLIACQLSCPQPDWSAHAAWFALSISSNSYLCATYRFIISVSHLYSDLFLCVGFVLLSPCTGLQRYLRCWLLTMSADLLSITGSGLRTVMQGLRTWHHPYSVPLVLILLYLHVKEDDFVLLCMWLRTWHHPCSLPLVLIIHIALPPLKGNTPNACAGRDVVFCRG